jgi:DNA-binding NarL/FixJ family response regulator
LEAPGIICVVGEATNGRAAVELAAMLNPNVILMDISMPGLNGLEACRQIITANPVAHVLILSVHNDSAYIQEAAKCGACGYLIKSKANRNLHKAITDAKMGTTNWDSFLPKPDAQVFQALDP